MYPAAPGHFPSKPFLRYFPVPQIKSPQKRCCLALHHSRRGSLVSALATSSTGTHECHTSTARCAAHHCSPRRTPTAATLQISIRCISTSTAVSMYHTHGMQKLGEVTLRRKTVTLAVRYATLLQLSHEISPRLRST